MKGVIYARYSSDNQREESIDAQIRECTKYATQNDIEIVKIYSDEAFSARTDARPHFLKMIKDSEKNIFDCIIIHKIDRFSRDRYDYMYYKKKLTSNGIALKFAVQDISDNPESILLESMLVGFAEYYSKNLATEVMKGMKENAFKCKFNGGIVPFGYDLDENNNFIINEYEASAIRYIFQKSAVGHSYKDIRNYLKEKGYKTRRGKDFSQASINAILKSDKYIGIYTFNKKTKKGVSKKKEEIIRIENGMPAIISKSLFQEVQSKMKENSSTNGKFKAKHNYLLSGKLYCGECGNKMAGHARYGGKNGKSLYISYRCMGRKNDKNSCSMPGLKREDIESQVLNHLENYVFTEDYINDVATKIIKLYEKRLTNDSLDITILEKKLSETQKKIDNIVSAIAEGMMHESMKAKLSQLEVQKKEVQQLLYEKQLDLPVDLTVDKVVKYLALGKNIANEEYDEQKHIISRYIEKIIVYKDKIKIHMTLDKLVSVDKISSGGALHFVYTFLRQ